MRGTLTHTLTLTLTLTLVLWLAACTTPAPTPTPLPPALAATPDALPLVSALASAYDLPYPIAPTANSRLTDALAASTLDAGFTYSLPLYPDPGSPLWSAPLALDGLVIVVHPTNPLTGLTLAQVRDIFAGRISNWAAPGSESGRIELLSREGGSDLRQVFETRALGGLRPALTALIAPGPQEMLAEVARNPAAIGYVSFGRLTPAVKALAVNGIPPSTATFERGEYPLVMPLQVVAPAEPTGEVRDFLIWVQSEEGQGVLGEQYGRIGEIGD